MEQFITPNSVSTAANEEHRYPKAARELNTATMPTRREVETAKSIADQTVGAALMNDGIGAEDFHHLRDNLQLIECAIKDD